MDATIPKDFLIGTSSSAWQVEGTAGRLPGQKSWADLFYEANPDLWHDHVSPEKASDFYHRYREDIKTMADFGMRAFRFTIQWARFMEDPLSGKVSQDAVDYYHDVIRAIRDSGMEPVISLEHWDIPAVLFEKYNGWVSRETVALYEQYVATALREFHRDVKYWFAFTEPNVPLDHGYRSGFWYPFKQDAKAAYQAHFHKILATAKAVRIAEPYMREGMKFGVMLHMTPVYARSGEIRDVQAAYYVDLFEVRLYLDPYMKGEFPSDLLAEMEAHDILFRYEEGDFDEIRKHRINVLGVDYYFPIRVKARETPYEGKTFTPEYYYEPYVMPDRRFNADRGWEIYPQAVYDIGERLKRDYGNPDWFISENGIGIENEGRFRNAEGRIEDDYRIDFLGEHLENALKCRAAGSKCFGYFVWSFIDNVSARNAFKNRYGLLELDLDTYQRIPKKSLHWFSRCLKQGEVVR
ncbi:glycoside hydrolase family 1 protein [Selenomonas felix]|uniref:glycoside hydrolase family 1 protein n=1 Tax=Selenomonas felix TaxID=1944634 RepID=UPI000C85C0BD|nr:glycoside hydrolase family 1 protein [Selenomonas felix]